MGRFSAAPIPLSGLFQPPENVDFADIVYQRVQLPLYIHFALLAQGKTAHFFFWTQMFAKTGSTIPSRLPPRFTVYLHFHLVYQVWHLPLRRQRQIPPRRAASNEETLARMAELGIAL